MAGDIFDLAPAYVMVIARGHCSRDANKRTACRMMQAVLDMNGSRAPDVPEDVIGQKIIALAQGLLDDGGLAEWLRDRA